MHRALRVSRHIKGFDAKLESSSLQYEKGNTSKLFSNILGCFETMCGKVYFEKRKGEVNIEKQTHTMFLN